MDAAARAELDRLWGELNAIKATGEVLGRSLEWQRASAHRATAMLERALDSIRDGYPEVAGNQVRAAIAELRRGEPRSDAPADGGAG